jgi:hypothetical protein
MVSSEAQACPFDCRLQHVPVFTEVELVGTSNPAVSIGTTTFRPGYAPFLKRSCMTVDCIGQYAISLLLDEYV